jgi:beta-phosphoglucomutase-like phosphatase (HAD superfamily)
MCDKPMAAITHILFDLDGLLIDTETCYTVANDAVAQRYGTRFTWDLKSRIMGRSDHESATIIINELKLPLTVDQLLDQIHEEFSIALKDVQLMPGAERLVRHLYASGIPMAIATGSDSHQYFSKIAKFDDFFSKSNFFRHYVLAGDDPHVKRGKPFPDVFIEAMNRFEPNLKPQNVLVGIIGSNS